MNFGADSAIWDDGEWVSWGEINQQIQYQKWHAKYPKADLSLVPIFEQLIETAKEYSQITGKHLRIYGDIGELYGAIIHGIKLHKNYAQGSDGRLRNDFIEIKTIGPLNKNDAVSVKLTGHFSKLFVVKINEDFEICGRMIKRSALPSRESNVLNLKWKQIDELIK